MLRDKSLNDKTVEASIALRTLLEYYRYEKSVKFMALAEAVKNSDVNFLQFRIICKQVLMLASDSDIADLYKESWKLAAGVIDAKSVFTAANDLGLFFKILMIKGGRTTNEQGLGKWQEEEWKRRTTGGCIERIGIPGLV